MGVEERLGQVKACLGRSRADRPGRALVSYDIIQVYKLLVLSCGITLEGSCEDPKVREAFFVRLTSKACSHMSSVSWTVGRRWRAG